MKTVRARRTMLMTPGHRPERIAKAATLDIDSVVLDLEDGVTPAEKPTARASIVEALAATDFGRRERTVRINAVGTPESATDLGALAGSLHHIDALFVPKVESADQLRWLDGWLTRAESDSRRTGPLPLIATIETPRGLLRALDIADATPRTSALFFGSGDYTAATGAEVTERALHTPRTLIVAAAAAAGLQAIDAAYFVEVKDPEATEADACLARELGFCGKVIFHPNQIAPCNRVFTPSAAEIARAERIIAAYAAAQARGDGTAFVDGTFIAVDIALMAERTLALSKAVGR